MAHERDLEERVALARGIVEPAQERARAAVVVDRLVVGVDGARRVAREQRVARGALGLVGLGEVARERPVDGFAGLAVERLDRLADATVQAAPGRLEQAVVGDLLDEAVTEPVLRRGPAARPRRSGRGASGRRARARPARARAASRAAAGRSRARSRSRPRRPRACAPAAGRAAPAARPARASARRPGRRRAPTPPLAALERAALDQILQRLLEEERVAAGALGEQIGERAGQRRLGERLGELAARAGLQRPQLDLAVAVREDARARARPAATKAGRDRRGR